MPVVLLLFSGRPFYIREYPPVFGRSTVRDRQMSVVYSFYPPSPSQALSSSLRPSQADISDPSLCPPYDNADAKIYPCAFVACSRDPVLCRLAHDCERRRAAASCFWVRCRLRPCRCLLSETSDVDSRRGWAALVMKLYGSNLGAELDAAFQCPSEPLRLSH